MLQAQEQQPTNNTNNLEKMIKQNDETAVQARADTFIGTIALLISLSLVIYNLWVSNLSS
jgi:hypothetical protein